MKNKFIFVVSLFCILFSMTAFANEWKIVDGQWKCYDKDGIEYTCSWQKSGDSYYYLNEDGFMAINALIQNDDGSYSYVDESGKKVYSTWIQVTDTDLDMDENWLYIKADGKSVKDGWYTVASVKYCFNSNKMLTGYISDCASVDTYALAQQYCADNGARVSGWLEVTDEEGVNVWLYFKNGKKLSSCIMTIDNKKYMFNDDGKMLTGLQATNSVVYNFDDDGAMVKKSWVEKTDDDGDNFWVYCTADGTLVKDGQYKINGKYYFFAAYVMKTGWQENKYYKADGDMATGRITITNDNGEDEIYFFLKDGTPASDGYNGYAYDNGKLIVPADDHKYMIYNNKLINKSGKYQGKGTYKDTAYDKTYEVDENGYVK